MIEQQISILIVDDEKDFCDILVLLMEAEGFHTLVAHDGHAALRMIHSESPDVVLLDFRIPGLDGLEVLKKIRGFDPHLPVIMITGFGDVPGAVKAMSLGGFHYFTKPISNKELITAVQAALSAHNLRPRRGNFPPPTPVSAFLREMMGPSEAVGGLIAKVEQIFNTDYTVLIQGETGSGKEVIARAIHLAGLRSGKPLVTVDCGAIPEPLLEAELFGYERGAFTGADRCKPGKFEISQGGVLFLDEISNMPLGSQAKFLRAIQEKKICRLGGTKPVAVDIQFLAASNRDLQDLVTSESFRSDLFYRLNEFNITIPPLRDRKDDIPYLAKRVLEEANLQLHKEVEGISESGLAALLNYNWPGNVRQLHSVIRRAVLSAEKIVTEKDLEIKRVEVPEMSFTPKIQGTPWEDFSLREIAMQCNIAVERELLTQVLKFTGGNKAKAARILRTNYKTFHSKVKKLRISIAGGGYCEKEGG